MTANTAAAIKAIVDLMRQDFRGIDGHGGLSFVGAKEMEKLLIEFAEGIKRDAIEPGVR